ncbi:hypothetical protein [Falsiroseomonas sp. E2-1-a20]|uniref:hypothetical protein n=1 Tax=Falsiroseomonas sp. E2-1-a20 TaxID=3239300 RepID=UPI003F2B0B25
MAVRRVALLRAVASEVGVAVPGRDHLEDLLRRGRAAGLLDRRRKVAVRLTGDPVSIKPAMWFTGARTVRELVVAALLSIVLPKQR